MNRHIFKNYVILLKGDNMEEKEINSMKETTSKINEKNVKETKRKKIKKHSSSFSLIEVSCLVILSIIISFLMGIFVYQSLISKKLNQNSDKYFQEFKEQYQYILDHYYEDIDKEKLIDGAISGMLESLDDEHSNFISEDNSSFDESLQGSYEGIGIEVFSDGTDIIVLRVFDNSSAKEAGIKPGDKIIAIDGKKLSGKSTSEFSSYIKKSSNKKKFKITYERDGKKMDTTVTKKYLIIPSVYSKMYTENGKKVGYLSVSTFSATTYNQFRNALKSLEKDGMQSLIIDLRGNSGGHLSVVTDMLSLFMDDSHVIYQIQTKEETTKYYSKGKKDVTYPIVILQDHNSASASELMASSLKEQLNAVIVGTTSYGKGTVQEVVDLEDGNQYKFTTKKWLTSKGTWIHNKGIKPNIEVELDEKYYETLEEIDDNQFQAALKEACK